jgi:hypothetical protein
MSFESAVALAEVIGVLCTMLWLAMPVTAVASIVRRRRHRPRSSNWVAYSALGGWVFTIFLCVMSFRSGAWYGENGPRPQIAAIGATLVLLVLVGIHFVLIRTSAIPKEDNRDST